MGAVGRAEDQADPALRRAPLRSIGIQPDALVLRSDRPGVRWRTSRKIALMCDVDLEGAVVDASTCRASTTSRRCCTTRGSTRTSSTSSGFPRRRRRLGRLERPARGRAPPEARGHDRPRSASTSTCPTPTCRSTEALKRRRFRAGRPRPSIRWIPSDECQTPEGARRGTRPTSTASSCPGGFGVRGIEGKLGALEVRARETASRCSASASACSAWSSSTPGMSPA